jgi:putative transport protein
MDLLRQQPLLLLFAVVAVGYLIERLPFVRQTLGVATVLFVGLVFGAVDSELHIPREIYELGLVLFVYTVGLSCGPSFFRNFKDGLASTILASMVIVLFAITVAVIFWSLGISGRTAAGFFAGSLTNTPALASITERLAHDGASERLLAEPIVGYSIAYPISILTVVLVVRVVTKQLKIDFKSEAKSLVAIGAAGEDIQSATVRVTRNDLGSIPIGVLLRGHGWRALFCRLRRGSIESLVLHDSFLENGDLVSVIGTADEIAPVIGFLGEQIPDMLDTDRGLYDHRRIFLSNNRLFGRRLDELELMEKYQAIVTRVRRGDNDFLAAPDMNLKPGDRLRVLAPQANMKAISEYLGDSYRALSEIDFLSFSLGLLLGFFVGQIPLPAPTGVELKLGIAGGPLVVAIILGWAGRTGPMIWSIPYSANLTLRQLGMVMFLAGVGTRAGNTFLDNFLSGGWRLVLVSAVLVGISITATLLIGYLFLRIPMSVMLGIVAGMQTQPALLSFATQQAGNDSPGVGYASVYPIAMILKILLAQAVMIWLITS